MRYKNKTSGLFGFKLDANKYLSEPVFHRLFFVYILFMFMFILFIAADSKKKKNNNRIIIKIPSQNKTKRVREGYDVHPTKNENISLDFIVCHQRVGYSIDESNGCHMSSSLHIY